MVHFCVGYQFGIQLRVAISNNTFGYQYHMSSRKWAKFGRGIFFHGQLIVHWLPWVSGRRKVKEGNFYRGSCSFGEFVRVEVFQCSVCSSHPRKWVINNFKVKASKGYGQDGFREGDVCRRAWRGNFYLICLPIKYDRGVSSVFDVREGMMAICSCLLLIYCMIYMHFIAFFIATKSYKKILCYCTKYEYYSYEGRST